MLVCARTRSTLVSREPETRMSSESHCKVKIQSRCPCWKFRRPNHPHKHFFYHVRFRFHVGDTIVQDRSVDLRRAILARQPTVANSSRETNTRPTTQPRRAAYLADEERLKRRQPVDANVVGINTARRQECLGRRNGDAMDTAVVGR